MRLTMKDQSKISKKNSKMGPSRATTFPVT